MAPNILLWGVGTSRTIRPHWALHELGLEYEMRPIQPRTGETKTAEFTALSPRQKIPLLQDDELTMGESAAIVAYLARRYGTDENPLMPRDPMGYAKWLEWCFFIMTELDATSLYVIRRHLGLRAIYGDAPTAVEAAKSYFSRQLNYVTKALSTNSRYLMGEQFNTADILLTTCLTSANRKKISLPSVCIEYLERTTARAAYRAAYATNYPQV